jgi:signal transduction histidine kinase
MLARLRNLRIQTKLLLMPLVALAAFMLILATDLVLERKNDNLLRRIESEYYPYHEISQKLEELLLSLQRNLQDAVSASDSDLLQETEIVYQVISAQLAQARALETDDGNRLASLEVEIESYYTNVRTNCEKMIAGESGERLSADLERMVAQYNRIKSRIESEIKTSEQNIAKAFARQRKNHKTALMITIAETLVGISLLGWLSLILTRLLTDPLKQVVVAVNRFAQHEENVAVNITSSDEIGELAAAFKEMSTKIRVARNERENAYSEAVQSRAAMEEHSRQLYLVNAELDDHRHRLEELVTARTAELVTANNKLQDENAMRLRTELVLKSYTKKLETRNRELQDFAYIASHDLQEPLRKIQAFGDRFKTKYCARLDEQGVDYLNRMQSAAGRMQRLIDDLLTYSRVTTQARPFTNVDLAQVVHEVVADLEILIDEVKGRVEVDSLPVIEADHTQIRQLMQNLIGNGMKFHRDDMPPVVRVYAEENGHREVDDENNCVYHIAVEDNGIGFENKYAERIFGVFQRLHGRDKYDGSGIGLAVCRKITERHGGEITASGTPGEGAKFVITLPVKQKGD